MLISREAYRDFLWAESLRRWSLYDITKRVCKTIAIIVFTWINLSTQPTSIHIQHVNICIATTRYAKTRY